MRISDAWREGGRWSVVPLALTLGLVGSTAVAGSAQAAPSATTRLPAIRQVDAIEDVTYSALFALGVQVYEVVKDEPLPNSSGGRTMLLKRVNNPRDGMPGSRRIGFLGTVQMYPAFRGAYWPQAGMHGPNGVVVPVDPVTLRDLPLPAKPPYRCVAVQIGQIGPLSAAGTTTLCQPS